MNHKNIYLSSTALTNNGSTSILVAIIFSVDKINELEQLFMHSISNQQLAFVLLAELNETQIQSI